MVHEELLTTRWRARVVVARVDPQAEGDVGVGCVGGEDHPLDAVVAAVLGVGGAIEVAGGAVSGQQLAGGLHDQPGAGGAPGDGGGVGLAEERDAAAFDDQGAVGRLDAARKRAVDGVATQQAGQHFGGDEVVDGDHLDVGAPRGDPQQGAADPAEAVDGEGHRHGRGSRGASNSRRWPDGPWKTSRAPPGKSTSGSGLLPRPLVPTLRVGTLPGAPRPPALARTEAGRRAAGGAC